jgi:Protein of unknown function (DUF2939)
MPRPRHNCRADPKGQQRRKTIQFALWPRSEFRDTVRKIIGGAVALVVVVAAYWGWALAGAAELASAASRGDAAAVMERIDLPSLSRSLSGQISRAWLDQNPQLAKLLSRRHGFEGGVINAAAAEMLLRAFLTPENLAALLNQEHAGGPDSGTLLRIPALGEAFGGGGLVETVTHSYFDGPLNFVIGLNSPDGRYGVHLNLSGTTWRLSGLDIPDAVTARVARQIADTVGGLVDRPGG